MIRDLYSSLTAGEQRAFRWSAAIMLGALWLSAAWADPWFLLTVPMTGGAFLAYRARHREDAPAEDDLDLL
jgi:hypothetical protein